MTVRGGGRNNDNNNNNYYENERREGMQELIKNFLSITERIIKLEERTSSFDRRIVEMDFSIKEKLKDIDIKIQDFDLQAKEDFRKMDYKLDEIISIKDKLDGSWKAVVGLGTIIVVASSGFAWLVDKWGAIKEAIF